MLKQTNYLISERQNHCDVCSEAVTNPLCPVCLAAEIDAWTTMYPHLRSELLPKIRKYLARIVENFSTATKCIKCKRAIVSICPFCFVDYVEGELKKIESNNLVLDEFIEFFDFDTQVPDVHKAKWEVMPLGY
jgi:hypothetical protein